jgi:hypothetical protein
MILLLALMSVSANSSHDSSYFNDQYKVRLTIPAYVDQCGVHEREGHGFRIFPSFKAGIRCSGQVRESERYLGFFAYYAADPIHDEPIKLLDEFCGTNCRRQNNSARLHLHGVTFALGKAERPRGWMKFTIAAEPVCGPYCLNKVARDRYIFGLVTDRRHVRRDYGRFVRMAESFRRDGEGCADRKLFDPVR